MPKLKPVQNRVVVKMLGVPEKETQGGILIPETSRDLPQKGEVIAVGSGKTKKGKRIPVALNEGDKVLVSYYAGTEVQAGGERLLVIREDDILGTVV
jgi:chaperonin GroES